MSKEAVLKPYIEMCRAKKSLTEEQMNSLFAQYKNGDYSAREEIFNGNLRLVVHYALKYGTERNIEDLVQEGNIGLLTAIDKFDTDLGYKFSTYAKFWIVQKMFKYIENDVLIHIPTHTGKRTMEVISTKYEMWNELGKEPTAKEIAERLGMKVDTVVDALSLEGSIIGEYGQNISSLNAEMGDSDDDGEVGDAIEQTTYEAPEDSIMREDFVREVRNLVSLLKKDEDKEIIKMYYGIGRERALTFVEIGKVLGCTKQNVQLKHSRAIRELKKILWRNGLTETDF